MKIDNEFPPGFHGTADGAASGTASAVPEMLARYAIGAAAIGAPVTTAAHHARVALHHLHTTRSEFLPPLTDLGGDVTRWVTDSDAVAAMVGDVAKAFFEAGGRSTFVTAFLPYGGALFDAQAVTTDDASLAATVRSDQAAATAANQSGFGDVLIARAKLDASILLQGGAYVANTDIQVGDPSGPHIDIRPAEVVTGAVLNAPLAGPFSINQILGLGMSASQTSWQKELKSNVVDPGDKTPDSFLNGAGGVDGYMRQAGDLEGMTTDNSAMIAITRVPGTNGAPDRYVVVLPGVHNPLPDGTGPRDGGDAAAGAIGSSNYDRAVAASIRANVPHGADVMLVGHSQGGIAAVNASSQISGDYHVTHVLTFGSPVNDKSVPTGTQVLDVQNKADPVPATTDFLGSGVTVSDGNSHVVQPTMFTPGDPIGSHSSGLYADWVHGSGDPSVQRFRDTTSGYVGSDPSAQSTIFVQLSS